MATTFTRTCDQCEKDIASIDSGATEFFLTLSCAAITNTSNFRFAVHYEPPFRSDKHFCGKACLSAWIVKGVGY